MIWTEDYLNTLLEEAEAYIITVLGCIFDRFSFAVTSGISVYTLPSYVNKIVRVTWKGKKLYPLTFQEFCLANPASAMIDNSTGIESPSSTPLYYVKHPTNFYDIRLFPTPGEDIAEVTSGLFGSGISTGLIVSCYRDADNSIPYLQLPRFIIRRVKKAYILSRAFAKEGKGQNLQAAQYYSKKLDLLMEALKVINSNVFLGKVRVLGDNCSVGMYYTPERPILPSNYPQ